jgi:hypothetical protein
MPLKWKIDQCFKTFFAIRKRMLLILLIIANLNLNLFGFILSRYCCFDGLDGSCHPLLEFAIGVVRFSFSLLEDMIGIIRAFLEEMANSLLIFAFADVKWIFFRCKLMIWIIGTSQ